MHYAKKSTYGKGIKACSLVLSLLLMCSMLFVGQIGSLKADASEGSNNFTLYIDMSAVADDWELASKRVCVYCWESSNTSNNHTYIATTLSGNLYEVVLSDQYDCIIVTRCKSTQEESDGWVGDGNHQTGNISTSSLYSATNSSVTDSNITVYNYNPLSSVMIPADTTIYVDCRTGWWANNVTDGDLNTKLGIWWQDTDGTCKLELLSATATGKVFSFTLDNDCNRFKMYRLKSSSWSGIGPWDTEPVVDSTAYNGPSALGLSGEGWITDYPTDGSCNCIWLNPGDDNNKYGWNSLTDIPVTPVSGGNTFNVPIGYENSNFETGYGVDGYDDYNAVTLFPVSATFYDYFTDYELENGWRSTIGNDGAASRTYSNRVPYKSLNAYISANWVTAPEGAWSFPMYFGCFYVGNTDYTQYPYGTLLRNQIVGTNVSNVHWTNNETQVYTTDTGLYNFSIFANDSNSVASVAGVEGVSGYTASVQNLVCDKLYNNQLMVVNDGTNLIYAPYFSDQIVTDGYANKITTHFPMRVETKAATGSSGTTVEYTSYEFDSGAKTGGVSDNIDFNYGTDGTPVSIKYGQGARYELKDAYKSLGGNNSGDHRGFFPFDDSQNGDGDIAYDYGFGMRLDIQFNLSKDGYIAGTNVEGGSYTPMTFEFEGDDDVWVFIDGKLALDLGGDHGNAKGKIDFAKRESVVYTGTITATSNTSYGSYSQRTATSTASESNPYTVKWDTGASGGARTASLGGSNEDVILPYDNEDGTEYDTTAQHTLTVFYMERGLIESNLKMSFSISPIENQITVSKDVVTTNVNSGIKSLVESSLNSVDFAFNVTDDKASNGSVYKYTLDENEVEQTMTYQKDGGTETGLEFSLQNDHYITFSDGFTDNSNGVTPSNVTVSETIPDTCEYTFNTSTVVKDLTNKSTHVASQTSNTTGAFSFTTASTESNAPVDLKVEYTNEVKTSDVTVEKIYKESTGSTSADTATQFSFTAKIKLPGETSFTARDFTYTSSKDANASVKTATDGSFTLTGGEKITISGLPVGSELEIEETTGEYTTAIAGGTTSGSKTTVNVVEASTAITYTNTKLVPPTVTLSAKKQIDGADMNSSSERFNFELVNQDANSSVSQTKQNDENGNIAFDEITLQGAGVYWFRIYEDTSVASSTYNYDTTTYYAKVTATQDGDHYVVTTLYCTEMNESNSVASVVFNNTSKVQTGNLVITKVGNGTNTDLSGTTFAIYKVSGENVEPTTGTSATATQTVGLVGSDYKATFADLEAGWYAIKETVAPAGYELDDEYKYVEVTANGTATYTFTDKESTNLPKTGGAGVLCIVVVGVILVIVGIVLLNPKKKEDAPQKQD